MEELSFAYATAGLILIYFFVNVTMKKFDPFAPIWLFLVGYVQIYVIQAIRYHDWGVSVHGKDLVASADLRAFWALAWLLFVYHLGLGRRIATVLPRPPKTWSPLCVAVLAPPLILWGLLCAGLLIRNGGANESASSEGSIFNNFPFVMLVAAMMLIVTGRTQGSPRPAYLLTGLAVAAAYVLIWMFNGKRSHSLIGVLATICAMYITRLRRPSWPVLFTAAFAGALVVAIAIGWRNDRDHDRSVAGFANFLGDFQVSRILESLNVTDGDEDIESYETFEYGGFLLMMDTVPTKSRYDRGANYLRIFSTYIPRVIWHNKPIYGRSAWISAWIAGSEMEREDDFSGPAISIMGATQLNGGAIGTLIVMTAIAVLLGTAYHYFRLYADVPWVQFWWSITFYNSWFMVVGDDPFVWFYYNWGISAFPVVVLMWWTNRLNPSSLSPYGALSTVSV
jgi:hypothetical protein